MPATRKKQTTINRKPAPKPQIKQVSKDRIVAKQQLAPGQELIASYGDVLEASKLARCSVHPNTNHIEIVQDGDVGVHATFNKTQQGFGQAIVWMGTLTPVAQNIKAITETALFYMLKSLTLPIDIQLLADTGFYSWRVLDKSGEAINFLDAMKKALNELTREYHIQLQQAE